MATGKNNQTLIWSNSTKISAHLKKQQKTKTKREKGKARRRPTLPRKDRSTIGAEALDGRV
ncbi:MAG: hypothetical protein WC096_01095, partial [Sphaerochaetaceae bacterium]